MISILSQGKPRLNFQYSIADTKQATIIYQPAYCCRLRTVTIEIFSFVMLVWRVLFQLSLASSEPLYDYIIVGGGATGCVAARTFTDAGRKVLLLERGGISSHKSSDASDIGKIMMDSRNVQKVKLVNGYQSHLAFVLGGGTSVNLGIWIEETPEYFQEVEKIMGSQFNQGLLSEALNWARASLARPVTLDRNISDVQSAYYAKMFPTVAVNFGPYIGSSSQLHTNRTWSAFSQFNSDSDGERLDSAGLLIPSPNLTVSLNKVVTRILFDNEKRAKCVEFRDVVRSDRYPVGSSPRKLFTDLHNFRRPYPRCENTSHCLFESGQSRSRNSLGSWGYSYTDDFNPFRYWSSGRIAENQTHRTHPIEPNDWP